MALLKHWKSVFAFGEDVSEELLCRFLSEFLVDASSHVTLPRIPSFCNTLGYQFIKSVHVLSNLTESDDYQPILEYLLSGNGWKIISVMLYTRLEGLTCVSELCNVITSLFPICVSRLQSIRSGIANLYLPPSCLPSISSCFLSPKKLRKKDRRRRVRKEREKERDDSSDSEAEVEKRPPLRIRFDRRDFEYFNRNMKSEDSLSDSESEHGSKPVFSDKAMAILSQEVSVFELTDLLIESCIIMVLNEKLKKTKNTGLILMCLRFATSQILAWDYQNASDDSFRVQLKLLKLFFTSCDFLCQSSDIFDQLSKSGVLPKLTELAANLMDQYNELNFNDLVLDTPSDSDQPIIVERSRAFAENYISGLLHLLTKLISAKYSTGTVRKFVDLTHDVLSKSADKVIEGLLKSHFRDRDGPRFESLLKEVADFVNSLKGYRDIIAHNQQCAKNVHKNCIIAKSHHHDIFGQRICALKLGNSNSCIISWCLTALFDVFDDCDEKWDEKILNAVRKCGLCCCLETRSIFEKVVDKVQGSKPDGTGAFRFLLFLYAETGLCKDCSETCMLCKESGGLAELPQGSESENNVSTCPQYEFFGKYYDLIVESPEPSLLAILDHLKQFSQSARQAVKQGLIVKVVLPALAHFKKLYLATNNYEVVLDFLLRILAVSLNHEIIQVHGFDSDIFRQISELLLKPQFSKSCARILHLATLLEVRNVDFETSSKPYTELLLAISDFHFSKLLAVFEADNSSPFYYELTDDRLKMAVEDVGYNSDYEKPLTKVAVRFGTLIEEDSATESAIIPSDRELSERESMPEADDAEFRTLPAVYVSVSNAELTTSDHIRVASSVWEALVLSMLYSQRLLEVVRVRPAMKKVVRLIAPLLNHVLKNEEYGDFGLYENLLVSVQICGPFHVFPGTTENPEGVTSVLIQCLAETQEIPVRFTKYFANSLLSAAVLRKFQPNSREIWEEKKAQYDEFEPLADIVLSDNDNESAEGYDADTEPCDANHHVVYEKFTKTSSGDEAYVVFPELFLHICDVFAIQMRRFCVLVSERQTQFKGTLYEFTEDGSVRLDVADELKYSLNDCDLELLAFLEVLVSAMNQMCGLCRRSPMNTEMLSREGLIKKLLESFKDILTNNYAELKDSRASLLELITLLGLRRMGKDELALFLESFKAGNAPLDELLRPLLQLAVSAPQPTHYVSFPAPRILPGDRSMAGPTVLQATQRHIFQDFKSGKSLPFSTPGVFRETETSLSMGKQMAAHHVMKGIVSAWESSALQVPLLSDHTWSPRNQGFSVAIWFYVKADSHLPEPHRDTETHPFATSAKGQKPDWREASMIFSKSEAYMIDYSGSKSRDRTPTTSDQRESSESSGDLHFFSIGCAGCLVEFWLRPDRENIVVRVSEATKTSYNVVATDKCQLPFMARAWHHLAVNCKEIVGFRKHSVEIDFFLDGITFNKLLIDLKKTLNRRYDRSCLLIGQTSVGVMDSEEETTETSTSSWFFGNVYVFKFPIFSREIALYLYALGPDCVDLAECDIDAMKMNILNVVTETAVIANLNWDLLLGGKNTCVQPLQEQLLMSYRSDALTRAAIYPAVISPSSDKRPSQQPPIEVPVSLSAELCPVIYPHITSSVRRLGGLSVLMFLLARVYPMPPSCSEWALQALNKSQGFDTRIVSSNFEMSFISCPLGGEALSLQKDYSDHFVVVVERSDEEVLQATALSLLLKYLKSSSNLQSEFISLDGRTLLQHLLSTPKFKTGHHALKVFLDLCSPSPVLQFNSIQNEFKIPKKSESILSNYNLLSFALSLWPLWCDREEKLAGPDSALGLFLKAILQGVREENRYCEFNAFMLNRMRIVDQLLVVLKEHVLLGSKIRLSPEICQDIIDIIQNVCEMPPKLEDLVSIRDFIILAHPSSLTYINQSSSQFFFVLPSSEEQRNHHSSGAKSANTKDGQSKSDRSCAIEPEHAELDPDRKDFAHPVDPLKLSKALANLQVKWKGDAAPSSQPSIVSSLSHPQLSFPSLPSSSSAVELTLKPNEESYSEFNHDISMEGSQGLERGEEALLDDWEHVTVRQIEGSNSSENSQPEVIVTSEKPAIPWEVFTRAHSHSEGPEEQHDSPNLYVEHSTVVPLVEGLLLFARDSVKVLPDAMVANVIDMIMKPEIMVVLSQNPNSGVRAALVKLLSVVVQRSSEEQLFKFVKLNGFTLLGNQLALYPATVEVVEACLSLILGQALTFEDITNASDCFPNDAALYQVAALPLLLSCLKAAVEDTALFHNLSGIIKDLAQKIPVVLTALVDFGLLECVGSCIHLISFLTPNDTDVVGRREEELLTEDLQGFLVELSTKLITVGGIITFQVVQDMLHHLSYLERLDSPKLGLEGVSVYRRISCLILQESLDTLEGYLAENGTSSKRPTPGSDVFLSRENSSRDLRKPQATNYLSLFLNTSLHAHYKQYSRRLSLDKEATRAEATERVKWLILRSVDYLMYSDLGEQGYAFGDPEKDFAIYLSGLLMDSLDVALGKNKTDNWSSMLRSQRDLLRVQFGRLFGFLLSPLHTLETRLKMLRDISASRRCEEILRLATITSLATEQAINQNLHELLIHHYLTIEDADREACLKVYGILQSFGTVHSPTSNGGGWSTVGWGSRSVPSTPGDGPGDMKNLEALVSEAKYLRAKWLQQLEPSENRARKTMEPLAARACESAAAITREIVELQNAERRQVLEIIRSKATRLAQAPKLWKSLSDRVTHDKAVWHSPEYFPENWQIDPTEGPDRMRIRLKRCFLDIGDRYLLPEAQKKKKVSKTFLEYLLRPNDSFIGNSVDRLNMYDTIRFSSPCLLIAPLEEVKGELLIGESVLYFVTGYNAVSSWKLDTVRTVYRRRHELQDNAVELFFTNSSTFLFSFSSTSDRDSFLRELAGSSLPGLASEEGLTELTLMWKEGHLTNFAYLMQLNTLAGRSYNDLMQYPVVPFVLADYSSECLDLTNTNSFRNLKKPMAVQDPKKEQHYLNNYNYLKNEYHSAEPKDLIKVPYHYGSHYSNSGIVLHFLVRLMPYTKLFLAYQDRNFDIPDRTFHNLGATWRLASVESTTDVKEMIPECFFLPEFLLNMNGFDFGLRQSGERVNHVTLPPWSAGDPRLFTLIHRQALEADYVRENLNHWIDLVFGYKQGGQAAVDSVNVFHPATYAGFDAESIPDPIERNARYTMIKTYGQTPKQLFTTPHPNSALKAPKEEETPRHSTVKGLKWGAFVGAGGQGEPALVWKQAHPVRGVTLCPLATGEVYGIAPKCALIVTYPKEKAPRNSPATSVQAAAVANWSHPDGLLRVRVKKDIPGHPIVKPPVDDKVAECACAPDSNVLWIGYTSGTVEAHQFEFDSVKGDFVVKNNGIILGNHSSSIVSIVVCKEFGVVVTGAADRVVMMWDFHRLSYVRSLEPQERDDDTMGAPSLTQIAVSSTLGDIVVASKLNPMESSLDLYTINGAFVAHARAPVITAVCYSSLPEGANVNMVVTGHHTGEIRFWSSWDFAPIRMLSDSTKKPVASMAYSKDCSHFFASYQDGTICVWEKKGSKKYNWAPRVLNLSMI